MENISALLGFLFMFGLIACIIGFIITLFKKNFRFKRKTILITFLICIVGFIVSMCLFAKFESPETKARVEANNAKKLEEAKEKEEAQKQKELEEAKEKDEQSNDKEESDESSTAEETEENEENENNEMNNDEKEVQRDNIIGKSDKSISDIEGSILFDKQVRNDVTGNLKLTRIADNMKVQEYALDYYNQKFENDKEIHAIVNFTLNTTTVVSVAGDHLDVVIHEYVKKEEHDAKVLASGMVLKEYWVYTDNGDIEEIR